jgi:hypothetical protein
VRQRNPFEVTKAVDLSDKEINDYWVDFDATGTLTELIRPESSMPMLILGGKGSGKTHLMRRVSYSSQKLLSQTTLCEDLQAAGYVGIYLRCGGLNSSRFAVEGADFLARVFPFYMDLWLGQLTLAVLADIAEACDSLRNAEERITKSIHGLLFLGVADHDLAAKVPTTFIDLKDQLHALQRTVDLAVNNYRSRAEPDLTILTVPGDLVFAIPRLVCEHAEGLCDVQFLYLIDELENLGREQQKYVNTLIRERQNPVSFRVGARLYGVKTYDTYSEGEANKQGSEYELLELDSFLREKRGYPEFARRLCARRLTEAGFTTAASGKVLDSHFEEAAEDEFLGKPRADNDDAGTEGESPAIRELRDYLSRVVDGDIKGTKLTADDVGAIAAKLSVRDDPILEKINLFLFYQDWARKKPLLDSASRIGIACAQYQSDNGASRRHAQAKSHFRTDFIAQLRRERKQKQTYLGLDTFISLSAGLPRNFLIVLKHVFQWAQFNGESPFTGARAISIQSQREGVLEAADWFFRDARVPGTDGRVIRRSIHRLANLLRELRFSPKPPECSLSTFSYDDVSVSSEAQRVIETALNWSLLINIRGGQRDRNSGQIVRKLQLNPMLAPLWDLPISRRGVIALSVDEIEVIFGEEGSERYQEVMEKRIDRTRPPAFGAARLTQGLATDRQRPLPGFESD